MGEEELFEQIYPGLRRFACAIAPPHVEPDDLVQEAVARTLQHQPLSSLHEPDVYLRRVVARLASNHRRDWRRRLAILSRLSPLSEVQRSDTYPSDLAVLQALPPESRAVLWLRLVERRTYREIAVVLEVREDALRARASRGLRQLRLELTEAQSADIDPKGALS